MFSAFVGVWVRYRTGTVSGPILDPILEPIWASKSVYFFTGAVQDGFQTVLRRLGRPSVGGPELDPKMDREKIGRKSETGQPPTLSRADPKPREGIKGWVKPIPLGIGRVGKVGWKREVERERPLNHLSP